MNRRSFFKNIILGTICGWLGFKVEKPKRRSGTRRVTDEVGKSFLCFEPEPIIGTINYRAYEGSATGIGIVVCEKSVWDIVGNKQRRFSWRLIRTADFWRDVISSYGSEVYLDEHPEIVEDFHKQFEPNIENNGLLECFIV